MKFFIPADVPKKIEQEFIQNYKALTKDTNRLFIFSCDQKIEHLNTDFYGLNIPETSNHPENLFKIANNSPIGGLATQLGLISRYAKKFDNINYIVKLNSKTNIIPTEIKDPISNQLWTVNDVIQFKKETNLPIKAVGITVYIGSEFENQMLNQAAQSILQAHQNGLLAIVWAYPRSKIIENERDGNLIAGAAGIANSLGADFVKVQPPTPTIKETSDKQLKIASEAAGNTGVLCAGGEKKDLKGFLTQIYNQIKIGKTSGCAIGRNIFQRPIKQAIKLSKAISSIVYENNSINDVLKIIE